MVEALPIARRDAEHLVNRIIEVAADPGRTNARLFRLEVQHLAHETGLPEEISVEAGAVGNKAVHVFGDHPKAEGPVPRDVLTAGDARGQSAAVPFFEQVQRKAMWARRRTQPHELTPHRLPEFLHLLRIASEHVETRWMRGRQGRASHGMDRPSRVGTRRANIRKKVAAGIAVDASMLTALLRPRMTFSAVNAPDRTGAPKRSSSEGNLENSSSAAILEFVVATATWSITGQSTPCSGLSTLAVPYHGEAATWDTNSLD